MHAYIRTYEVYYSVMRITAVIPVCVDIQIYSQCTYVAPSSLCYFHIIFSHQHWL